MRSTISTTRDGSLIDCARRPLSVGVDDREPGRKARRDHLGEEACPFLVRQGTVRRPKPEKQTDLHAFGAAGGRYVRGHSRERQRSLALRKRQMRRRWNRPRRTAKPITTAPMPANTSATARGTRVPTQIRVNVISRAPAPELATSRSCSGRRARGFRDPAAGPLRSHRFRRPRS